MIEEVRTTATIRVDQATTFTPTLFSRSNGRGDPPGTMTRRLEHISQDASSAQFWYTFEGLYGLSSTEMTDLCVLKLYKRNPHETCKVLSPPSCTTGCASFPPDHARCLAGDTAHSTPCTRGCGLCVCVLTLYLYVSSLKGQKTRTATATKRCRSPQAGAFPQASPCPRLGTLALAGRVAG